MSEFGLLFLLKEVDAATSQQSRYLVGYRMKNLGDLVSVDTRLRPIYRLFPR
jgi:hypothetical protein